MVAMNDEVKKWAEKYVPKFNELSKKYQTAYYTQSPLNVVEGNVDTMVIGINPKGCLGGGEKVFDSADDYLKGNPTWAKRFLADGSINPDWKKFLAGSHTFLGYDHFYHPESIDNDQRTVWTNLSPFVSANGHKDLYKELMTEGVKSTLELIEIVKPKYIVLLGKNAFMALKKNSEASDTAIEYTHVFSNRAAQIGRIYKIPAVCVVHPSRQWEVSNKFIPAFIFLHKMSEMTNRRNKMFPLNVVADNMRREMRLWQDRVII